MSQRMQTTPFTAVEVGTKPRVLYPRNSQRKRMRKDTQKRRMPTPLMIKMGICAVACAMMFIMKDMSSPIAEQMVSGVKAAVNDDQDFTEMLGKLQFVEFPNALEVFSGASQLVIPVSASNALITGEEEYAQWEGAPNAVVVASAAGEVRAIGEDATLGQYVRLAHAGELETIYYGLETIQVEQGQPVRRQDTLGMLGEQGILRLSVMLAGKPQPPSAYLNLGTGG